MEPMLLAPIVLLTLLLGVGIGFLTRNLMRARRFHRAEQGAAKVLDDAVTQQKEILLEAKEEALKIRADVESETRSRRSELHRQERRISQKEENLDRKTEALERKEHHVGAKEKEIDRSMAQLEEFKKKQVHQLELISGMSTAEAKELLLTMVEEESRQDMAQRIREIEAQLKEEADQKAREIVASSIQRCATDVASETTVSVVPLPSDDMKGRLIGREGRNIRALSAGKAHPGWPYPSRSY
jgi:ribonuclease Y